MNYSNQSSKSFVKKMLNFDTMITPIIIKIIYIVSTVVLMLIGLFVMIAGLGKVGGGAGFFIGFLIIISAPFLNRIWCEGMIVIFKIHENLDKIANRH